MRIWRSERGLLAGTGQYSPFEKKGDNKTEIRVDLTLHNETAFAEYSLFAVSNETEQYNLIVAGYSGNFYNG